MQLTFFAECKNPANSRRATANCKLRFYVLLGAVVSNARGKLSWVSYEANWQRVFAQSVSQVRPKTRNETTHDDSGTVAARRLLIYPGGRKEKNENRRGFLPLPQERDTRRRGRPWYCTPAQLMVIRMRLLARSLKAVFVRQIMYRVWEWRKG